jgi:tRNA pseudouridine38-40 synthase
MERNLKAIVRYDGTDFAGWQVQPGERTVQGVIEDALSQIAGLPVSDQADSGGTRATGIRIHGAGRTDAGVHALGQVFSFSWPGKASPNRIRRSLSKMLGPEIRVDQVEEVPPDFHAQKCARGKRYAYAFNLSRETDPLSARYAWCVPWPVDMNLLRPLAARLAGEHNFAGFQSAGTEVRTTVRTLYSVGVKSGGIVSPCDAEGLWRIEFHGNGFLYKMVRNITGTLIDIARGNVAEQRLDELLASPGPFKGRTAPPHGLALLEVIY